MAVYACVLVVRFSGKIPRILFFPVSGCLAINPDAARCPHRLRSTFEGSNVSRCPPPLTGGQKKFLGVETGAKISVDWLSLTFKTDTVHERSHVDSDGAVTWYDQLDDVKRAVWAGTGIETTEWIDRPHGWNGYNRSAVGPGGALMAWDAVGREDYHVSLPGQACGMFSETSMRSFLRYSQGKGARCTRLDINLDDYDYIVTPFQVEEAAQGPDIVTHVHRGMTQRGFGIGTTDTTGVTVYIGQPSSRQRLRVYDKGLESAGEIPAIRWELQSRAEAAETLLPLLGVFDDGTVLSWGATFSSRLVSFVDFRNAADHPTDARKRDRLEWFKRLVGSAEKASAYPPRTPRYVNDLESWVESAVGPTLRTLYEYYQRDRESRGLPHDDNLTELRRIMAEARLKPKHHAILDRGRKPVNIKW